MLCSPTKARVTRAARTRAESSVHAPTVHRIGRARRPRGGSMRVAPAPGAAELEPDVNVATLPTGRVPAPVREPELAGEALPLYLQEIGRVSLLTGPEE